jgi:serine/threonine protein kinase
MSGWSGTTVEVYRIEERIGQGGMATVYKAYHPPTDRYVAIKVLLPEATADPQFMLRFDREAKAIASLQHIHILPVFDYGQHDGMPYLVMRYVPTGTLKDRLAEGRLSLDEAARLFCQIAEAVEYAHQKGILHRDLKPANVLLDDSGNALLSDFGLARLIGSDSSLTGINVVGTPLYMSPDQAQGKALDARSDVYSLGVILYEMMVGEPPFSGDTPLTVVYKHASQLPPSPRAKRPDLPEEVEQVILKALAKKEEKRFQTAGAMIAALQEAMTLASPAQTDDDLGETALGSAEDLVLTFLASEAPTVPDDSPTRAEIPAQPLTDASDRSQPRPASPSPITSLLSVWRLRRGALAIFALFLVIAGVLVLRDALVSFAVRTSNTTLAGTALDTAALLGRDVGEALRQDILAALAKPDEARALRLAGLYADRISEDPTLSDEIQARARDSAAAGQAKATLRYVHVLVVIDPVGATALAGEFNDAGVAALLETQPKESVAQVYLDAVRAIDESLGIERSRDTQSVSLYNQAQLLEAADPIAAAAIYREAIHLNSNNIEAYYALSSLLLTAFNGDPDALDEAVEVARSGYAHIEDRFCQGTQSQADQAAATQSWLCFLLMTTEAGARLDRGDDPALIMPLVERAIHLAEANDQFGPDRYTAEAYYYLARLTEPDTDTAVLCNVIQNHNRDLDRHRAWALYANQQLGDRRCLPG